MHFYKKTKTFIMAICALSSLSLWAGGERGEEQLQSRLGVVKSACIEGIMRTGGFCKEVYASKKEILLGATGLAVPVLTVTTGDFFTPLGVYALTIGTSTFARALKAHVENRGSTNISYEAVGFLGNRGKKIKVENNIPTKILIGLEQTATNLSGGYRRLGKAWNFLNKNLPEEVTPQAWLNAYIGVYSYL